ncbi:hypothetical protein NBRC116587_34550 [Pseudoteredinibacter isoporae]
MRHGQAAASWGEETDPGLSETGRLQAASIQEALTPFVGAAILSSPKARAQETACIALPGIQPSIDTRFTEIPSGDRSLADRGLWLRQVFRQHWSEQERQVKGWREGILNALYEQPDSIIFCHFVVINAVVSVARNDDRVMQCRPDYCSMWEFEVTDQSIRLLKGGKEDESLVL